VVELWRDLQSSNRVLPPPLPREGRGGRGVRGPPLGLRINVQAGDGRPSPAPPGGNGER